MTRPVVVYGAGGYTGRLVCEYLSQLKVPFIAAGWDKGQLDDGLIRIPGIEAADFEVAESEISPHALAELLSGAEVVINTVGPFVKFGAGVVEASLDVGCHYIDASGEQEWLLEAQSRWSRLFAAKELLLAPGIGHMYTTGEIAANLCLETPGLDTLDILSLWKGVPSAASTQTIFEVLTADWFYLEQNEYKQGEPFATFDVAVPGQHETALALPWGGTAHPVWFKNDPRVANVKVAAGVSDKAMMEHVLEAAKSFKERGASLLAAERDSALEEITRSVQPGTPPRENPRMNTTVDSVYASGPAGRAHCVIHGNSNYKQTALLQAYAASSLLQTGPLRTGFASACQAFGHRQLLGALRGNGLVLTPMLDIHTWKD